MGSLVQAAEPDGSATKIRSRVPDWKAWFVSNHALLDEALQLQQVRPAKAPTGFPGRDHKGSHPNSLWVGSPAARTKRATHRLCSGSRRFPRGIIRSWSFSRETRYRNARLIASSDVKAINLQSYKKKINCPPKWSSKYLLGVAFNVNFFFKKFNSNFYFAHYKTFKQIFLFLIVICIILWNNQHSCKI